MLFEYISCVMITNVKRQRDHHDNGADDDDDADDNVAHEDAEN